MEHGAAGTRMGAACPPLRILLAEDEAVNRLAAAALLRRAGHAVVMVEDGPAAVAAALGSQNGGGTAGFDLILMDLGLPGFDGDEAVRRIRNHADAGRAVRILMLTATATPDGLRRCRDCGADGMLTKPFSLDALAAALDGAAEAPNPAVTAIDGAPINQMRALLPGPRVAELIAGTARTLRQYRTDLSAAWSTGDRSAASKMAHKIAGVAGQYGCVALRRAAQSLEAALEAGATGGDALAALDGAYGPALAHLDANAGSS